MHIHRIAPILGIPGILLFMVGHIMQIFAQLPKSGADFSYMAAEGGWTWYGEPKAVYYEGTHKKTYLGWISDKGVVGVGSFDHETGDTAHYIINPNWRADDHNHPSLIVRPDGRIMVFYTGHNGSEIRLQISTNPEDITSFEREVFAVTNSPNGFCYPNVMFLEDEGDRGRIYLFYRGLSNMPCYSYSDDWGATWRTNIKYFQSSSSGTTPYVKYCSNSKDEIYIMLESDHRLRSRPIHFMTFKKGVFYQIDGTRIADTSQLPIKNTQIDIMLDAGRMGCHATGWDIALDESGNPVVLLDKYKDDDNHVYYYFRWTGPVWFSKRLVNSGALIGGGNGFAGGITFDHANPNIVYLSRQITIPRDSITVQSVIDSTHELDMWFTRDGGETWDSIPITRNSPKKNVRPCVPRGYKEGGKLACIWMYGDYISNHANEFPTRVNMFPFDDNEITTINTLFHFPHTGQRELPFFTNALGISFLLINPGNASLQLYDIGGKLVADFTSHVQAMETGFNSLMWNHSTFSSGTYIVNIYNGAFRGTGTATVAR